MVKLAKLLGAFVLVDLYFFGCDLLTEAFPGALGRGGGGHADAGPLAPYFWTEVVGCAALRRHLLRRRRLRTQRACWWRHRCWPSLGIFCKRVQLLVGGFQIANLDMRLPR